MIGILSDTHGQLHPGVIPLFKEAGVAQIWHAGDVGAPQVLEVLAEVAPLVAVRGNVDHDDWAETLPLIARQTVVGRHLVMTHIAGRPDRPEPTAKRLLAEQADLFICGHSHRQLLVRYDTDSLWLNPGAAGRQGFHRRATVALARLDQESIRVELVDLGPK